MGRVLAADLGGTFIKFAAVDPDAAHEAPLQTRPTPAHDFDALLSAFAALAEEAGEDRDTPLVIASAGTIDPGAGEVIAAANIPCLTGRSPARALADRLGRRVVFVNDADAFTLAEALLGSGAGHRIVLGAILGTGIGGGLVVEGRLVRGAQGIGGEWGHGPVQPLHVPASPIAIPPMPCGCGRTGCPEAFGSARGLERIDAFLTRSAEAPRAAPRDSHAIVAALRLGDPTAARTVAAWAQMLAGPLAVAVNVTGATVVPVGGGIGLVPELRTGLDAELRARILLRTDGPVLLSARFGERAGLVGAALLAGQMAVGG